MKCVVTGGCGFIGSHLVELLVGLGHNVTVIDDLSGGKYSNIAQLEISQLVEFIQEDITSISQEELCSIVSECEYVFHLAGKADIVPSIENPRIYYETNVNGTYRLLMACRGSQLKKFVYAASSSCYGIPIQFPTSESASLSPQYPYALTKLMGEQLVMHWAKVYGLKANSLRLFNVYGPRARTTGAYGAVFGVFLAQKLAKMPYTVVGDGSQTRDFTYVSDVTNAFYLAAVSDIEGEIFNVGSGNTHSINEVVELLGGEKSFIPKRPGEPDCTFGDITKIKQTLGWAPKVKLPEGIGLLLDQINDWKDAPLWDPDSIESATKSWFEHLQRD